MTDTAPPDSAAGALELADAAATQALGARLAHALQVGDVVLLRGELGAGKTTLARGLIAAWTGVDEDAPSPTYTLVQVYEGPRGSLWHMDLYRLRDAEEALELGLEDALAYAVTIIEWPERLGPFSPPDRVEIDLTLVGAGRRAAVSAFGRLKGALDVG
ncbi:MAG: tRNA (adenosine(37)-N6)-threonylcarbamoyltransferase complex ATPase subunit type 1 TsaE [Alphaproteobacteria bacterium]|nr:tRNA (adenosine(37)-N6)-threonylcarbamoyltransferase complex ATPase subunit type 1 TsaE [Alphaproteobacteria bacterium]